MELTVQLGASGTSSTLPFRVISHSDQGDRTENQDALLHLSVGDWLVCVLADGAGGHRGGEVASKHAVAAFLALFEACPTASPTELLSMVHRVNNGILDAQQAHPELADMHTTLCALVFNQRTRRAVCLHVGDSRIYRFHQSNLLSRSKDHSVLQWMLDHAQPEPANSRNALYTALGEQAPELHVEISEVFAVSPGDWFLLCSDGLWEHFSDAELGLLGVSLWHSTDCCTHIHQLAMSRAGGRADNLSSIFLFTGEGCHSIG